MGLFSMSQTLGFVGKLLDNRVPTEPIIRPTIFKPSVTFSAPNDLPRNTTESQGIPSSHILNFLKALKNDRTLNIHSIGIMRNGTIVCEAAFGAQRLDTWKYTFSACKSVVSLAIGILIDDGLLSVRDRVADIFPKEAGPIGKLKLKDLTIEDLLTMRSSVSFSELDSAVEENWLKGFWTATTKGEAGKTFRYNSMNTYLLSAIVTAKTGKSLSDFLDERLFSPLGIDRSRWYWEVCPKGIEKGGWGLYIRQDDFLKIAQLVMQNGIWNGNRIISEEYVAHATDRQVIVETESALFDYGYQMWVGKQTDTFLFNGMLGQNVIGFRNNGIVVTCFAGNDELFHQSNFFKYVLEYFDRPFEKSLKPSAKNAAALSRYIQRELATGELPARIFDLWRHNLQKRELTRLLGAKFFPCEGYEKAIGLLPLILQLTHNEYATGFARISFARIQNQDVLVYEEEQNTFQIPLAIGKVIEANLSFGENHFLVAVSTKVNRNEDDHIVISIRVDFLEFPCSRILKLVFLDRETVLLRHEEHPGCEFVKSTTQYFLNEISEKSIVHTLLDRLGYDYIDFKAKQLLAPELILTKTPKK